MPGLVSSLVSRHSCLSCRRPGGLLCARCAGAIPRAGVERLASGQPAVAAWVYAGIARRLILALKVRGLRDAAGPLAAAMHAAGLEAGIAGEVVAWVPGRASDIRGRGFDHAEVLARLLGHRLGLPVRGLLRRVADPPDQTSLSRQQRQMNLVGTFEATGLDRSGGGRGLGGVVLVDDLLTTGATAAACAAALSRAGTASIEVMVAGRALRAIGSDIRG